MQFTKIAISILIGTMVLSGCGTQWSDVSGSGISGGIVPDKLDKNEKMLSQASNEYVIPEYSEITGNLDTTKYFDALLLSANKYFVVEDGSKKYLLAQFAFYGYGSKVSAINAVEKKYNGDELIITIDPEIEYFESMGCEPEVSRYNCSFELEKDFNKDINTVKIGLANSESEFTPYEGGIIAVDGKYGVMDAELNEIVPVDYDSIMRWGYAPEGLTFYMTRKDDANGLMDENFNQVLSNSYSNIAIVDAHKFIAMRNNPGPDRNYEILILDENENEIGHRIIGFLDGYSNFNNQEQQVVFGRFDGNKYYEGVIDGNLNVVIEPIYEDVVMYEYGKKNGQFYVVQNNREEFAVIDSKGVQRTEYVKGSAYEVKEAYINR